MSEFGTNESKAAATKAKKRWTAPKLVSMVAGSAEFGAGVKGDGAGGGSIHS